MDVNANVSNCLRTAVDIGFYRVHNVCTGEITAVPWGAVDWLGFTLVAFISLAIIAGVLALFIAVARACLGGSW